MPKRIRPTVRYVAYYMPDPGSGDWRRWTCQKTLEACHESVANDETASKKPVRYFKETVTLEEIK